MSKFKKILSVVYIVILLIVATAVLNKIFAATGVIDENSFTTKAENNKKEEQTIYTIIGGNVENPTYKDELDSSYWLYCLEQTAPLPYKRNIQTVKELGYDPTSGGMGNFELQPTVAIVDEGQSKTSTSKEVSSSKNYFTRKILAGDVTNNSGKNSVRAYILATITEADGGYETEPQHALWEQDNDILKRANHFVNYEREEIEDVTQKGKYKFVYNVKGGYFIAGPIKVNYGDLRLLSIS